MADIAQKKMMVEAQDLSCQIGEIKDIINTFGRKEMSLDTQLKDIKRLVDFGDQDQAYFLDKFRHHHSDYKSMKMKRNAERDDNTLAAFPKVPFEIQLLRDKFENRTSNSIRNIECSRSTTGYGADGDEEMINAQDLKIALTGKTKKHAEAEG